MKEGEREEEMMLVHRRQQQTEGSGEVGVKQQNLTYLYLLIYIALSTGQIFFNKWVLSSKQINFPYPLGLTLLHMLFSSILCFIVTKVLKLVKVEEGMTPEIYASSVFPIGAMFAMTLWLGNTAYLYISVAFAQMLKAIMPVAVLLLGAAAGLEVLSCRMFMIMSVISFGVLVASYGEINISWVGVVYQMGGVVGEALRLIFMEILVKRKGLKLNPITLMYYVSPCSAICLFIPWIFLEKPKMDSAGTLTFHPFILSLNSLCTFALNVSVFVVISHTSAVTIRVAGVVKDWVVVLLSAVLFADSTLTTINLLGYGIDFEECFIWGCLNEVGRTLSKLFHLKMHSQTFSSNKGKCLDTILDVSEVHRNLSMDAIILKSWHRPSHDWLSKMRLS